MVHCSGGRSRCERIGNAEKCGRYSPPRRGGVDTPSIKWIRSEIGAAGVVRSAKPFRPKHFAELTTPAAASSVASRLLLMPQPSPPLRGGEYRELNFSPIRSHLHKPPLQHHTGINPCFFRGRSSCLDSSISKA